MDRPSKHLSWAERGVIGAELGRGSSQGVIGRLLGRTICRELARGRQVGGSCCPTSVRHVHDARRMRRLRKLVEGSATCRFVHGHLGHRRRSPEQIAQGLRIMEPGDAAALGEP